MDTSGVGQVRQQGVIILYSFGVTNNTAAMFSETDGVVKIVSLSIDLDWMGNAFERFSKSTIVDPGIVAAENHADDATLSNARFTKDDDVWSGFLRN